MLFSSLSSTLQWNLSFYQVKKLETCSHSSFSSWFLQQEAQSVLSFLLSCCDHKLLMKVRKPLPLITHNSTLSMLNNQYSEEVEQIWQLYSEMRDQPKESKGKKHFWNKKCHLKSYLHRNWPLNFFRRSAVVSFGYR